MMWGMSSSPAEGSRRRTMVVRFRVRTTSLESATQAHSQRSQRPPMDLAGVSHMRAMLRTPDLTVSSCAVTHCKNSNTGLQDPDLARPTTFAFLRGAQAPWHLDGRRPGSRGRMGRLVGHCAANARVGSGPQAV